MHEMAVVSSMMEIVFGKAAENNAKTVKRVDIAVGNLSGVVPDSLRFCFDALKNGTIAGNAELMIDERYATGLCASCGKTFKAGQYDFSCPSCGCGVTVSGGDELFIKSIEVE